MNRRRTRGPRHRSSSVVTLGLAVSVLPIGYLHLASVGVIDPVRHPISDYVAAPHGSALLAISFAALIVSAAALVAGLRRLPGRGMAQALLMSWCLALALAAIFPTNVPGTPADAAALVHRYAAGWLFLSLPWAGWLLARRCALTPAWRPSAHSLRRLSWLAGAASAALLSCYLVSPGEASPIWCVGLLQRGLLALDIALIAVAALAVRRAAAEPSPLITTTRQSADAYERTVR
jgi:hypothetical protein